MAEQKKPVNPADLVPFVDPDKVTEPATATPQQVEAETGYRQRISDEDFYETNRVMGTLRSLVNKIPTPSRDEGDALGSFSAFAIAKDTMTGILDLMEMPWRGQVTPEEVFQATLDFTPGAGAVASKTIPAGGFGMFGSKPSKYASPQIQIKHKKLTEQANQLDADGWEPEAIWKETGMSKDHRGKWRYAVTENIDDPEKARVQWKNYDKLTRPGVDKEAPYRLQDVLDAPNAYAHWPELKDVPVFDGSGISDNYGWFDVDTGAIYINKEWMLDPSIPELTEMRVLVHEAQHALQYLHGRPRGAGVDWIADDMDRAIKGVRMAAERAKQDFGKLTNSQEEALRNADRIEKLWNDFNEFYKHKGKSAYMASPGEVEARMAEMLAARPELAKLFPLSEQFRTTRGVNAPHVGNLFSPDDLSFPRTPTLDLTAQPGKKTFGTRVSESRAPYDGQEGSPNLPANQQRGTLTDDIMDDLSMYQMSQRADRDFYMNYINERMKPFALEMADPDNVNLPPQRRAERLAARAEEIQIRKGTIRALLGEGDDPSVWNAVRINQDAIRRLEEEMTALSGTQ